VIRRLLSSAKDRFRTGKRAGHRRLRSADELQEILERERCRADRTGASFCLLRYEPRHGHGSRRDLRRLITLAQRRIRLTDDLALVDQQRLAVVLSGADEAGAWHVADDVTAAWGTTPFPFTVTVYCYPSTRFPAAEDDVITLRVGENGPLRHVRSLELFFLKPLPLWKRGMDILGALVGLVLLSPLLLLAALLVKLGSRGPVLFRQVRAGYGGRPFVIYKFRSMRVDAEAMKHKIMAWNEQDGAAFKIREDPRITRVGRLLRSTSIDELPQLWNVLRGDMSLVGPRPLPCAEAAACATWQRQRLDVIPGLTCTWQVKGRSRVTFDEWMRMDLRYIRRRGWRRDLKLILLTVVAVLRRTGAH
jgi:lipopolysaccharide/colanic/teichoic acid biosynthesis glycosyltransferase